MTTLWVGVALLSTAWLAYRAGYKAGCNRGRREEAARNAVDNLEAWPELPGVNELPGIPITDGDRDD